MGAKANRSYIASVLEATWGVMPATPTMQKMNFVSESLSYALETTTPDSIRDDRQTSDVINVSAGNEGGFEFEMQALLSNNDELLLGALWAERWLGGTIIGGLDLSGAIVSASGKSIDFSGAPGGDPSLTVGWKIKISGSASGNDGIYTIANDASAPVYILEEAPAQDETLGAGSTYTEGQYIENGFFEHSFTIERGHPDVGEYFLYRGMVVNEFSLNFEAGEVVTGEFTFIGKDTEVTQTPNGNSYLDPSTRPFMSASFNISDVKLDGAPIPECLLQSVELNINNNVEGKLGVGVFGYCDTAEGEFEVTGGINLYFNDSTMYQKFVNSESFSLEFTMTDNDGSSYVFHIPKLKLSSDAVNVEGKNTDVMDAAEYVGLVDEAVGYTIRIDRFMTA